MENNVTFTICAKNYLAQALTLRESFLAHNKCKFLIFLSDLADCDGLPDVIELNDNWIPNYQIMAFKYSVIEFSTSIKPFCFKKLFDEGYDKVMYLDPDIYVCGNLDIIFSYLDEKSIVLTPHRCNICHYEKNLVQEQHMSKVGIFNLGFIAVKKDEVGIKIIEWWKEKLTNKCLNDSSLGLFVDQKWIDYIPGYFPNDIHISKHLGLNVATWNLQERNIVEENGTYSVIDELQSIKYNLLFFHFSGYSPLFPDLLDKRRKNSSLTNYPSLKKLVDEYKDAEVRNNFMLYTSMQYSFNYFSNKEPIPDFVRKWYYMQQDWLQSKGNPFNSDGYFYSLLSQRGILPKDSSKTTTWAINGFKTNSTVQKLLYWVLKIGGMNFYLKVVTFMRDLGDIRYHHFLIEE